MKIILKYTLSLVLCAGLFFSCEKEEVGYAGDYPDKAKFMFIHAAGNADTRPGVRFSEREIGIFPYYNGVTYNNFPLKMPYGNGYKVFDPGILSLKLDSAWSPANEPQYALNSTGGKLLVNGLPVYRDFIKATIGTYNLNLAANSYYTLFAIGNIKTNTVGSIDTFMVKDDINRPAAGKLKVKFLHFSTDAGPVDIVDVSAAALAANPNGVVVCSNLSYKQRRPYVELPISVSNARWQLRVAGTSTVIKVGAGGGTDFRDNVVTNSNGVMTVYLTGYRTPVSTNTAQRIAINYHYNNFAF